MLDIIIKNIGSLVTAEGDTPLYGKNQGNIKVYNNVSIGIKNGIIECIGDTVKGKAKKTFNANGALVTPGLIDCHTHFILYTAVQEKMRCII